jgi:hypothetical protein
MPRNNNLEFVWPKDGLKGNRSRSYFGGLKDILLGKGPDMFIRKVGSKDPIKTGYWSNW